MDLRTLDVVNQGTPELRTFLREQGNSCHDVEEGGFVCFKQFSKPFPHPAGLDYIPRHYITPISIMLYMTYLQLVSGHVKRNKTPHWVKGPLNQ